MTVKSTVSFTDRHHRYARRKVAEGACGSVSALVAQAIERLIQEEEEREIALDSMAEAIRARMATPRENWVEIGEDDPAFAAARARLEAK